MERSRSRSGRCVGGGGDGAAWGRSRRGGAVGGGAPGGVVKVKKEISKKSFLAVSRLVSDDRLLFYLLIVHRLCLDVPVEAACLADIIVEVLG